MAPSKQTKWACPTPPPPPLIPVTSVATSRPAPPVPPSPQLPALRRLAWPSFRAFISSPGWPVATCLQRLANKTQVPMELWGIHRHPHHPLHACSGKRAYDEGPKIACHRPAPLAWVGGLSLWRHDSHSIAKPSYWIALAVPPWCFINTQTAGLCPARWHAPEGWTVRVRARGGACQRERERQGVWLSGGDPTCSVTVLVPARSH